MSNDKKISRYPVPEVKDLPEDIQAMVNGAQGALGFVPNVLGALTYHPGFLRFFMSFDEHMKREDSGLNSIEREMMIVVFSVHNGCDYCIASHGMTDDDIFDTLAYAAFYNMSNRMMSGMRVQPDEQFAL